MDVTLEALVYRLPEVRVLESGLCVTDPSQSARVAALWEEARTVLTAAQISLRDRLFEGHLIRYVRGLQPRTLRVLAASLAKLGQMEGARQVMQDLLRIEPHLTATKLRWRLRHMDESVLTPFLEGLRLAGLPE